ncbi:ionotropic receptor 93a-like [Oratosquilla oratoria]|uniref:ionotropic receptor 93a-like n=1 Tax=Oratosquilla oratoria TaxID=337810 RepID=UPI003F770DDD
MYPFDLGTWLALVASIVVATVFFHAFVRSSTVKIYDHDCDVISSLLWMLRAILRQSVPAEPSFRGSRLFLVCWWLAAFIVATSYTGNLVAFITVPAKARKIQTLDELADSDLQLEMLDYGEYIPGYLATSDVPVFRRIGTRLQLVDDYAVTFDGIRQGTHALLEALAYMEYVVVTEGVGINIYMIREKFAKNNLAWIFPRGTPWRHKVDWCLNQFVESGLVNYWKANALKEFRQSEGLHPLGLVEEEEQEKGERPLNLEELQGSFFILAIGLGLSFLVLLLEVALNDLSSKF